MVKQDNKRITITLSKNQITWLENFCKDHHLSPSKYIAWLLYRKADEIITLLKLKDGDQKTLEELIEIAKTPIFQKD